jgi:hypothetical protein
MSITESHSNKVKLIPLTGLVLLLVIPAAVHAQAVVIEAESFVDFSELGNVHISAVSDSGCSGRNKLVGLDYPEEWTEYPMPLDSTGVYAPRLWCRGNAGQEYHLQLTLTPDTMGSPQTIDFTFTGIGYG